VVDGAHGGTACHVWFCRLAQAAGLSPGRKTDGVANSAIEKFMFRFFVLIVVILGALFAAGIEISDALFHSS
jgi:hypothetical protein